MYLMGQRDVTGTRVGENSAASDWTTSKQRERQSCLTLYLGSNTKVGASGKRNTCTCYFSSLLVFNRGLWFPAKNGLCCFAKTHLDGEENSKWLAIPQVRILPPAVSCIQRKRNLSCKEVQTQESKTIISESANTLIPMVIRIRDFKFRKTCT